MVARYISTLPAFLPVGPLHPVSGEPTSVLLPAGEIEFAGEPHPAWTPINEEAVEALRAHLRRSIARQEETISLLDAGCKTKSDHQRRLLATKRRLEALKSGSSPDAKADALMAELDGGKAAPANAPLKAQRPSDSPNRR